MNRTLQTLIDELGNEAMEQARRFLQNRYPAGYGDDSMLRALTAIKRQRDGLEVGALEREFTA